MVLGYSDCNIYILALYSSEMVSLVDTLAFTKLSFHLMFVQAITAYSVPCSSTLKIP